MTRTAIAKWAAATVLLVLAIFASYLALRQDGARGADPAAARSPATATEAEAHPSVLHGRVTTVAGATYEGRLRFGRDEEAFWGDYFNGVRKENRWLVHVPPERLPSARRNILGLEFGNERPIGFERPFMARFGDIARIDGGLRDVRVTLKSGTVVELNRLEASDFDDGVRVWDVKRGVVDLDSRLIRTIELLPPARPGAALSRLHGAVRTPQGEFTGFLQWNREEGLGTDALDGRAAGSEVSLPFDTIRSIARHAPDSSRVILRDGREIELSGTPEVGEGNRGIYVDDPRYGRVLVSWGAFERVDFSAPAAGGSGPAYGDFPPGRPLTGSVMTRNGRRLPGRLVFDLDESENTETLDAPSGGVDYTIPFELITAVVPRTSAEGAPPAIVTLLGGEQLHLDRTGDLGDGNAGLLIFVDGREPPEYVSWSDVARIDFGRPPVIDSPAGGE